mmetsp:Transcript_71953/g.186861  ORF Transcript_71953/g.186861 Transcript_71953/m.186861 type:complete len:124 (+) Transcript_71953:60-431(+)
MWALVVRTGCHTGAMLLKTLVFATTGVELDGSICRRRFREEKASVVKPSAKTASASGDSMESDEVPELSDSKKPQTQKHEQQTTNQTDDIRDSFKFPDESVLHAFGDLLDWAGIPDVEECGMM